MEEGINLTGYLVAVAGTPLLFVVWGLVEYLKRLKGPEGEPLLKGNWILTASLLIGAIFGFGYWLAVYPPAPGLAGWGLFAYIYGVLLYGLGLGVLASLFFEALKAIVERMVARLAPKE